MTETTPSAASPPVDIWERIAVQPVADPLAVWLARRRAVTPNRITGVAAVLSLAAAGCFVAGQPRLGGLLFLARFFADCLDGKVARAQGSSSRRGAALDLVADVGGIALIAAAFLWYLGREGHVPQAVGFLVLAAMVFYNWALAYRKDLAHRADRGDGGAAHRWETELPVLRSWVAFSRRRGMAPLPWAIEAEVAMLGVGPLVLPTEWLLYPVLAALLFYLLADAVNLRRIWHLATLLDQADQQEGKVSECAMRRGNTDAH